MDADGGARDPGRLAQEGGLALIRLDQVERHARGESQDQPGKAGAGAEVDRAVRARDA